MQEDAAAIELVHSAWINYERAGDLAHALALCADEIEFWPPNAPPIIGRESTDSDHIVRVGKLTRNAHPVLSKNSRLPPQRRNADKPSKWVRKHCAVRED
jgi:hypothetical protein